MVQLLDLDLEAHRTVRLVACRRPQVSSERVVAYLLSILQIIEQLPVQHLSALSCTCRHFRSCVLAGSFAEKLW